MIFALAVYIYYRLEKLVSIIILSLYVCRINLPYVFEKKKLILGAQTYAGAIVKTTTIEISPDHMYNVM